MSKQVTLKRSLSLPMMVLYGLGTTIGAGIYALVGEIAAISGYFSPLSFLLASMMAGFTAISFAELSSRYPRAAGAALYVREGLSSRRLSTVIGILVVIAGLVSAAALINGFFNHIQHFITSDRLLTILLLTLFLGGVAAWGISESVILASIITVIEVSGLLLIIYVSRDAFTALPDRWMELIPSYDIASWKSIFFGATLAFYAFIGFEDMIDVAEEVKDVKHNLPLAILLTLSITIIIYVLVMLSAILSVSPSQIASSEIPLAYVYQHNSGQQATIIMFIGMFAVINGALIQMVMASRVLYGLSYRGQLPAILSTVHHRTRTPVISTSITTLVVVILALTGNLVSLAQATSIVMLTVFSLVNLALWRIKQRDPHPIGVMTFPFWIPIVGFFVSSAFVIAELVSLLN